jgi:uncharacterized domain 1
MKIVGNFDKFLGYEVVSAEGGKSEVRLEVRDELKQRFGLLHGGAIATFADFCMASALFSLIDDRVVTAEMNLNYIKSIDAGTLRGIGEVKRVGNKVCFAGCRIFDESNDLIATASGVYCRL